MALICISLPVCEVGHFFISTFLLITRSLNRFPSVLVQPNGRATCFVRVLVWKSVNLLYQALNSALQMVHLRTGVGGMGRASASQTLKGSDDGGGAEGVLVGTVVIGGQQTGTAHRNSTAEVHTGSAQWLCAPVKWHRKCITEVRPGCARRKCPAAVRAGSAHRKCTPSSAGTRDSVVWAGGRVLVRRCQQRRLCEREVLPLI